MAIGLLPIAVYRIQLRTNEDMNDFRSNWLLSQPFHEAVRHTKHNWDTDIRHTDYIFL